MRQGSHQPPYAPLGVVTGKLAVLVFPVSQMRKLSREGASDFPKVTQLGSGRGWSANSGFLIKIPVLSAASGIRPCCLQC